MNGLQQSSFGEDAMIFDTADTKQMQRCQDALLSKITITETFYTEQGPRTIKGPVQSVVDNGPSKPRRFSITFLQK